MPSFQRSNVVGVYTEGSHSIFLGGSWFASPHAPSKTVFASDYSHPGETWQEQLLAKSLKTDFQILNPLV